MKALKKVDLYNVAGGVAEEKAPITTETTTQDAEIAPVVQPQICWGMSPAYKKWVEELNQKQA
jgi:hypothetical protein